MKIEIDKKSGIPLYLQIKHQIKKLLENGNLKEGEQLPTERDLSENLQVSRNTVSMAYKELVLENIILSIPFLKFLIGWVIALWKDRVNRFLLL